MSVLVKGMEMPVKCRDCRLKEYTETGETWCKPADGILADVFNDIPFIGRPEWCPLVEVPSPHGRLIDADALADKWIWGNTDRTRQVECIELHDLEASPTVIEAEGEG